MHIILMRSTYVCMGMILMVGCSDVPPEKPKKIVSVEVIQKQPFHVSIDLIGRIEPKHLSVLTAKAAGAVDFHVKPGDVLKKDALIASIQNNEAAFTVTLSGTESSVAKAQFERAQKLGSSRTMSQQEIDSKRLDFLRTQKQEADAQNRLENYQFLAPFDDGVVGVFKVREGAHMQPGDPLVTYYKPDEMVVNFGIPESIVSLITPATKVMIQGVALPLIGFQNMIDPITHMAPAYVNYTCKTCVIGGNVTVTLIVYRKENDISVPHDALTYSADGSTAHVYVVKDGKANLQPVTVGHVDKKRTQIVKGLNEGDRVVATGVTRLYPGIDVEVYTHDTKVV